MYFVAMNNYHTHTYLCKHAEGAASAYAEEASRQHMEILGFSDHTPLPDNRWPEVRMAMDDLDSYERQIDSARREFPGITILKGLECEWDPGYRGFYHDEILGQRRFDYLIGAVHFFKYQGSWHDLKYIRTAAHLRAYTDLLVRTMESGLFAFIAHPDGFGSGYDRWDSESAACSRDIFSAAAELGIPLEINGYGFRKPPKRTSKGLRCKYPLDSFWELASSYSVKVICNSDAHRPEDVGASIASARDIAGRFGLDIIEKLPMREAAAQRR